jgi:hypothetical protein
MVGRVWIVLLHKAFEQFSYNPSFIVGANEDRHGMGMSGRRQDPFFCYETHENRADAP